MSWRAKALTACHCLTLQYWGENQLCRCSPHTCRADVSDGELVGRSWCKQSERGNSDRGWNLLEAVLGTSWRTGSVSNSSLEGSRITSSATVTKPKVIMESSCLSKAVPLNQSWSFGWRSPLLLFQPCFFTGESFHTCSGSGKWQTGPLHMAVHHRDREGSSVTLLMLINKGGRDQPLITMPCVMNCLTFIWLKVCPWWNEPAVNLPTLGFLWNTGSASEI